MQTEVSISAMPLVTLNNGVKMPILGLGVYQSEPGLQTLQAVGWALESGYRHIDTAKRYGNEEDVGEALRRSGIPREEIFVTTKLWNEDQGYEMTLAACTASLNRLGLEYVDLYLVHWPVPDKRLETWRAMVKLLRDGRCRAIGVSNYTERHLEELLDNSEVVPTVNQVEFSPFLHQRNLLAFSKQHAIQLEAYGPLTQGQRLDHPAVVEIAQKHERTPAQVMIRWAIELGLVVIPKSVHRERILENAQVFDFSLGDEDRAVLNALNENLHTEWDPTEVP